MEIYVEADSEDDFLNLIDQWLLDILDDSEYVRIKQFHQTNNYRKASDGETTGQEYCTTQTPISYHEDYLHTFANRTKHPPERPS
jgi:hypothetical protein